MENLDLGEKIMIYRKRAGLKQYELAEKAYITPLTLVRIENGRTSPHSSTLAVIADALGVSVGELKGDEIL